MRMPLEDRQHLARPFQHLPHLGCALDPKIVLHIEPLMDWAKIRGIKVDMGILEQPNFLSLAAVPDKIRKQVPDKFQNLLAASPHDPDLTLQLRDYVDWYDPNGTWQTVLPEWLNVLK